MTTSSQGSVAPVPRKLIRVVVIDDDRIMRRVISTVLQSDREIHVVAVAANANQGRRAVLEHNPDVVTLDVMMPDVDGLTFLEALMQHRPVPVVMISGLTSEGSEAAIRALELGAVECFEKPSPGSSQIFGDLPRIVKAASMARVRARSQATGAIPPVEGQIEYKNGNGVVAIGSSTGGVDALAQILSCYPANCPPTLVVQHMPAGFTAGFAARLNRKFAPNVVEAVDGARIEAGNVYIAPGGGAHLEVGVDDGPRCILRQGTPVNNFRPSVDVLFKSLSLAAPRNGIGVILTGMGDDGASGLLELRKAGARTFGQNEETSVIYGMPRVAFERGAVETQLPLDEIGPAVLRAASTRRAI